MSPNKGSCIVYIEELAEKRSVAYASLQPMGDSKWTLPHRFKRNRGNTAISAYDLSRKLSLRHHPFDDKKPTTHKKHQKLADIDSELFDCTKGFDSRCQSVDKYYDYNFDSFTDLSHFQPYSIDLVTMPMYYHRQNNNHSNNGGGGGVNSGNASTNHNQNQNQKSQRHSPNQQQQQQQQQPKSSGRNGQQAPKPAENQIQLLKRDRDNVDEEKDFQVMTPTPTAQPTHGSEHQTDMTIPPPPIPIQYGNNGGFVQYYYPGAECVDPSYYNVPAELMASQPIYQVPAPAYATGPIPMQAAAPYAVAPAIPANQLYTVPMAGWPNPGNPTSKWTQP